VVLQYFEPERRKVLVENILVTGASSAIPGLAERIEKEIGNRLSQSDDSTEVHTTPRLLEIPKYLGEVYQRQECAEWVGASITAKFFNFFFFFFSNSHSPVQLRLQRLRITTKI